MSWSARAFVAVSLVVAVSTRASGQVADGDVLQEQGVRALQDYFARVYGEPANFETRLGGLVSVVSLSRFDGEPLAERLLEATTIDDPLVALAAWDALAARSSSLTPEQNAAWRKAGVELATGRHRNDVFFAGQLRPLLQSLAGGDVEARVVGLLVERAIEQNDLETEAGRATLVAAGTLLRAHGDKTLLRPIVAKAQRRGTLAVRAHAVLSVWDDAPAIDADRRAWNTWLAGLELEPTSSMVTIEPIWFEPPIVIDDSNDPRFRKDVELGRLNIAGVDVALAIDATGSLETSNAYILHYLGVLTQTLAVLGGDVRVGVCYYRHEVRPELQVDCCREAMERMRRNEPLHFLVDMVPLTGNFNQLLQSMNEDRLPSSNTGHDNGRSALAAGFEGSFDLLQRMSRRDAARVILLQGDANPTRGSTDALMTMAGLANEAGVVTVLLIRDKATAERLSPIAQAAAGYDAISYRKDMESLKSDGAASPFVNFEERPFGLAAAHIVAASLPSDYADRGTPVVRIVSGHLSAAQEASRASNAMRR
ncbi:MAG: vWA domain-containing protein [Planctomycetota bacterium]